MNKNIYKIVLSSLILQILIAVSGFILPKLFIETYGSEVNGLVNSIKQFLTYFSSISLGLGAASAAALYEPLSKGNYNKISSILSASKNFFYKTGFYFFCMVLVLAIIYPILIDSNIPANSIISIIIILGVGGVCEYSLVSPYRILLVSDQKNYIVSKITAEGVIINLIISVIMIKLKYDFVIVQVVSTFVYIFRLLYTKIYVKNKYPKINYKAQPNFDLINNRWDAFYYELPRLIINYSPVLLISLVLSLSWVSIYSIYNMIASSLFMIISTFSTGINAIFGKMVVENDLFQVQKKFDVFNMIFQFINLTLFIVASVMIIPFIKIYINTDINYIFPFFAWLFIFSTYLKAFRLPYNVIIEATGNFKDNKVPNIIEAMSFVSLSILLSLFNGINGIMIALIITSFIRNMVYINYTDNKIFESSSIKNLGRYFILSIYFITVTTTLILSYRVSFGVLNWIGTSFNVLFIVIVINIFAFYLFYNVEIKMTLKYFIKWYLKRRE
ncbi:hypothetical protein [Enterococcus gallinarum]|nr:hypothetical protein [Enterococcus gallinarum]MCC2751699.1 hypothetical protein [Enterococcus gallinarum]